MLKVDLHLIDLRTLHSKLAYQLVHHCLFNFGAFVTASAFIARVPSNFDLEQFRNSVD